MTNKDSMRFNGSDYDPSLDDKRLSNQHERIKALMIDGKWRTLSEIGEATGDPVSSISAQLRHLRKPRYGGFVVDKRARGERNAGLFEYQVSPKEDASRLLPVRKGQDALHEFRSLLKWAGSRGFVLPQEIVELRQWLTSVYDAHPSNRNAEELSGEVGAGSGSGQTPKSQSEGSNGFDDGLEDPVLR